MVMVVEGIGDEDVSDIHVNNDWIHFEWWYCATVSLNVIDKEY